MKVIGKLSEGKATHIPYRDSKLTRLLESSLSGHGHVSVRLFCLWLNISSFIILFSMVDFRRIFGYISVVRTTQCSHANSPKQTEKLILYFVFPFQLICTITPASSSNEETHNTLKFASRAKSIEIYASRNQVIS